MKRREDRNPLSIDVAARIERSRATLHLSDLSCRGCRIVTHARFLTVGTRVTIRPNGMEGLIGTVRWSDFETAGMEFDYPLHPAVADHLCRQNPSVPAAVGLQ